MTESHDDEATPTERPSEKGEGDEGELHEQAATGTEPGADFGAGKGPAESDTPGVPDVEPGAGGYAGRDPATDMPRIPSVPETQEDAKSHGGAPPTKGKDRDAGK
jgi:hypothetical protein